MRWNDPSTSQPSRVRGLPGALPLMVALGAFACGHSAVAPTTGTTAGSSETPSIRSISITGPARLALGSTPANLTAMAAYSDGSQQDVTALVTWTSSAPGVATVSSAGALDLHAEGDTTISAGLPPVSASLAVHVSPRSIDVRGRVEEAYGGAPMQDATVTIDDGPDAGRRASTDVTGAFVLSGLQSANFIVSATATDFELDHVRVSNGTLASAIRLEPLMTDLSWHGLFTAADLFRDERVVTVRHSGPVRGTVHADCPVGSDDSPPLGMVIWNRPFSQPWVQGTTVIAPMLAGATDSQQTVIVRAGVYYLAAFLNGWSGAPSSCAWRMEFSYPR